MKNKAFTLIELLVVIFVLSILFSVLCLVAAKAKEKARAIKCLGNERSLCQTIYGIQDHFEWLYLRCPDDKVKNAQDVNSYGVIFFDKEKFRIVENDFFHCKKMQIMEYDGNHRMTTMAVKLIY